MAARRVIGRAALLGAVVAFAAGAAGCYQRRPVDARAVLEQLRRGDAEGNRGTVPAEALDEDRAIALALVRNPELRAFRLERGVAEGEVIAAGALANPELRLELTHLQNGSNLGWGVGLAWEPPQPIVRSARKAAAAARSQEVEHAIAAREWEVASDVREAFAALAAADETVRLAGDSIGIRARLKEAVDSRLARGAATRVDADLSSLAVADAERVSGEAALARKQAQRQLSRRLGLSPDAALTVAPLAEDTAAAPPACATMDDVALAKRPAVAAATAHHTAADETARLEHARRWPWFHFVALPRVRQNEFFGHETDWVLGLELTLPVFDWNTGRIKAAEAARDRAEADLVATVDGVRRDVAAACADVAAQRELLRHQRERLLPVLEEHDRLMNQALKAHEVDLTAIILSEGRVLETRLAMVRTRLALQIARIALDRAVGARVAGEPVSGSSPR